MNIYADMQTIGFYNALDGMWVKRIGSGTISVTDSLLRYVRRSCIRPENIPLLYHSLAMKCIARKRLWVGTSLPKENFAPDLHKHLIAPLLSRWLQEPV